MEDISDIGGLGLVFKVPTFKEFLLEASQNSNLSDPTDIENFSPDKIIENLANFIEGTNNNISDPNLKINKVENLPDKHTIYTGCVKNLASLSASRILSPVITEKDVYYVENGVLTVIIGFGFRSASQFRALFSLLNFLGVIFFYFFLYFHKV